MNMQRHDSFISIESMTPDEYKNGGESLTINYSFAESPFGDIIVAATPKGICYLAFSDDPTVAFNLLQAKFPKAHYHPMADAMQQNALLIFSPDWKKLGKIKLHLKGTDFQLQVWEALLKIPTGSLTSYGSIAAQLNRPKATRAVGTAIGNNPVSLLVPCHRVVRSSGGLGGYHWGLDHKVAIIDWEATKGLPSRM
jgi:AraC family transcriptional regulator of adaptative response/methylated-DNA-[protein]-cysteine methyltransferase